jgi:aspartate racemase
MLGGMSWESTASYYVAINQGVSAALGGLHSAKICLYSLDFDAIERLQREGDWDATARLLADAAAAVEAGGADFLIICTNTMHKVAEQVGREISIPILHIADATAEALVTDNVRRIGLLGTRFTMEQAFYKNRLQQRHGIEVITPDSTQRELVHDIIYNELCLGTVLESSRGTYLDIIDCLHEQGAEAIVLGCTEIALLVQQAHTPVRLYDTTAIHAAAAVRHACSELT